MTEFPILGIVLLVLAMFFIRWLGKRLWRWLMSKPPFRWFRNHPAPTPPAPPRRARWDVGADPNWEAVRLQREAQERTERGE